MTVFPGPVAPTRRAARSAEARTAATSGAHAPHAQGRDLAALPAVEMRPHGRVRAVLESAVAVAALVLLLPLLVLIAVLIAATSPGPVLFRQVRVGHGGRTFELLKFRTMYADADERAAALFAHRDDGSGPLNKLRDDPRVTSVGRLLRRVSLDELPQLWNVVNGTMALVGPRPSIPREVALFAPGDHQRHAVRPGMTGPAQVSGRSDLDWERAVALDLAYVERRSALGDVRILLRTVPAILGGRGAY